MSKLQDTAISWSRSQIRDERIESHECTADLGEVDKTGKESERCPSGGKVQGKMSLLNKQLMGGGVAPKKGAKWGDEFGE